MDYNSHMPRANRYFVPGYACHLTHRCHNREFLPRFATDRDHYRMLLREGMLELRIALLDFCITSNHVHVLALADEDERISAFMQKIQGQFGQAYNRRNKRSGIEERTAGIASSGNRNGRNAWRWDRKGLRGASSRGFKVASKWRSWLMAIDGYCGKQEPNTTLGAGLPKAERDGSLRARRRAGKTAAMRFCIDNEMRNPLRRNALLRSDPDS